MNKLDNMVYIATFPTYYEANLVLSNAYEIINFYGYLTMEDMNDLSGLKNKYTDNFVGWDGYQALDNAVIKECREGYSLYMPDFNWHPDINKRMPSEEECSECDRDCPDCGCHACERCEETEESQGEPIDITISFDKYLEHPEVFNDVLQALIKDPEKIKDRHVFITIG